MSRLVQQPVEVETTGCDGGPPVAFRLRDGRCFTVASVLDSWREWFGVLEGEPERDVWQVETPAGFAELHCVYGQSGQWLLHAWLD